MYDGTSILLGASSEDINEQFSLRGKWGLKGGVCHHQKHGPEMTDVGLHIGAINHGEALWLCATLLNKTYVCVHEAHFWTLNVVVSVLHFNRISRQWMGFSTNPNMRYSEPFLMNKPGITSSWSRIKMSVRCRAILHLAENNELPLICQWSCNLNMHFLWSNWYFQNFLLSSISVLKISFINRHHGTAETAEFGSRLCKSGSNKIETILCG